jgi:hypothetical protein
MFGSKPHFFEKTADGNTCFRQKRAGRSISITIDRTGVDYEIKDVTGEVKFHAAYEEIDPQVTQVVEKSGGLFNLCIILLVFGLLSAGLSFVAADRGSEYLSALFFIIMSTASYGFYRWRKTSFSIMNTERGRMSIIRDARHDEILRELNLRRVTTLRSKYLQIDHDNLPKAEMGKYNWLRKVGAITDVELSQFSSMLRGNIGPRKNQPPTISQN